MASPQPDPSHGSSLRLRVASWGDPGLDVRMAGAAPIVRHTHAAQALNFEDGVRTDDEAVGATHRYVPAAAADEAASSGSADVSARQGVESDSMKDDSRKHNLRLRSGRPAAALYDMDGEEGDDVRVEDSEEEAKRKSKKKVGRPLAYTGDPNSPHLSQAERRQMRRRVANREAARRVRSKRQEIMDDLHAKISTSQVQNEKLAQLIADVERQKAALRQEIRSVREKCEQAVSENAELRRQVAAARRQLEERQMNIARSYGEGGLGPQYGASGGLGERRLVPSGFSLASSLPTAGSSFELPSLLQLTPMSSWELRTSAGEGSMQRQSSMHAQLGRLPDIQPLTGLQQLGPPSSQRSGPGREDVLGLEARGSARS